MTKQGKERRDRESFVAVTDDLEIHGFPVEPEAQERDHTVDGNHAEDTDDTVEQAHDLLAINVSKNQQVHPCWDSVGGRGGDYTGAALAVCCSVTHG